MTTEEMKALRRVGFQAWNEGRPELLDEVYAPNFRNHFSGETLDVVKQNIRIARFAFPGLPSPWMTRLWKGTGMSCVGRRVACTVASIWASLLRVKGWNRPASPLAV